MIINFDQYKERWGIQSDPAIKPGLEGMTRALALLNNPHEKLRVVHVAGTNGKGSTIAFLEQMALHHGLSVGKFTSPCIVDVHDQIQVNLHPISRKEMDRVFETMKNAGISGLLTDFELLTCAAFLHFANEQTDLVLLETGLGGLEDSTNVVDPLVSIITSIDFDHTNILGDTLEQIAHHKAGIIKKGKPAIIGSLQEEALSVIKRKAALENSPLSVYGKDFYVHPGREGEEYIYLKADVAIDRLTRKMAGAHQRINMALAITAFLEVVENLRLNANVDSIRKAVEKTSLAGRFEQVFPKVYFDGAHNPASIGKLVETIKQQFPNETIRFVIGMVRDKDIENVLRLLETVSDEFYFVDFENPRAAKAKDLMQLSRAKKKEIVENCASFIQSSAHFDGVTIVTGSLYLLAEIRNQLISSSALAE
ncbi:folylpolyglutamate synthase/dihydrofolate synthase family protein [Ureibacillus sp. FSL K6-8385]|uniref:bifunctional folylpolyglutamate synthase/dihydrofolate synthase n=1 Tax=Ureibacillus TaxID=160795 RepID=UPI002E241AF8|nr:bifunctional folylpolyglutamate synthase/dihydrofolate synthase [Ureibacillus terrenus]MED3763806.1 bifunctional folylpolyglutamate synthase/dihydrofolate synthase [Ureibacillus terrenus]